LTSLNWYASLPCCRHEQQDLKKITASRLLFVLTPFVDNIACWYVASRSTAACHSCQQVTVQIAVFARMITTAVSPVLLVSLLGL
jgi:hypothetical protein